jgi:hypothetical protein
MPFYNACHFPFTVPEGQALFSRLSENFHCSTNPIDAIEEILQELKRINPKHFLGLELHALKQTDGDLHNWLLILDDKHFVSSIRCYERSENILATFQLDHEMSMLSSLPSYKYILGCFYFSEELMFRFNYVDRQASYISAQQFRYTTDPLLCATNFALMCMLLHSPEDEILPVKMPESLYRSEPPSKRPNPSLCSTMTIEFNDIFK